jgi:drug/metabolite transporter (DMT)-like permease
MSTPVHTPITDPIRPREAAARQATASTRASLPDDGTRPLLQGAFWTLLTGILAALATLFVFGGVGIHGPHTNGGWLSLIVAMMCLPFGCMLLVLGGAKYLRNLRLARKAR